MNLVGLNFVEANCYGANFVLANCVGTNFFRTNLTYTNCVGTNFANFNFIRAVFGEANFSGANLNGAILKPGLKINGDCRIKTIDDYNFEIIVLKTQTQIIIKIGCHVFLLEEWEKMTDADISSMDKNVLEEWQIYKHRLFEIAKRF